MSTLLKYLYIPVKIIWWQPYWYIFIYHSLGEEKGGGGDTCLSFLLQGKKKKINTQIIYRTFYVIS